MLFRKIGCLVGPENWVKLKIFSCVDRKISGVGWKWFEVKIFTSNHFQTHVQREREIAPKERSNPEPRALQPCTLRLRRSTSTSNRTLQLHRRTQSPEPFDFAVPLRLWIAPRSNPLTSLANPEPRSCLQLCRDRTKTTLIALRSQLRNCWVLMNLTGFDEFFFVGFCFCVYLLRNCIIYLFGSWENVRNMPIISNGLTAPA